MARDVLIRLKKLSTTGKVPANAAVRFEPTVLRADADGYILDDYFDAVMVDGEATVTDLPETDLNWAYKVQVRGHGRGAGLKQVYATWYVHLPEGEGTVNFEDLPRIDPKTLTPVNDPDPAWVDAVTAVFNDSVSTAVEPAMVTAVDDETSEFRARLNDAIDEKAGTLSSAPQIDYVSTLAGLANYDSMTVTKLDSAGKLEVTCSGPGGGYVRYTVTAPHRYQYVANVTTLDPSGGGEVMPPTVTAAFTATELTLTNFTWKGATNTPYVEQVDAVWTASVTTTHPDALLRFQSWTDNRGGLWRISVDGTSLTADVSVWRETPQEVFLDVLTIPEPGTYTIRGTFVGDDPANTPTAAARGWTKGVNTADPATIKVVEEATVTPEPVEISPQSNKDFAVKVRPLDVPNATNGEFIPYHGTASEAFAEPTRYYNAGQVLDVAAMTVGQPVPVESFEWVQHIWGRNSNTGTRNIAEVWTTQKITPNGVYHVTGRWKALEPLTASQSAYHLMLMGVLPVFDEAVSSLAGTYTLDGSTAPTNLWTDEGNRADSWALLSSTTNAVAAVRHDNRRETLRTGQEGTPEPGAQTFIELRAGGNLAKVYPSIYAAETPVPEGRTHRFGGAYFYGSAVGARDALTLS